MRIQIQLQELEKKFWIEHGKRKTKIAMKLQGTNFRFPISNCRLWEGLLIANC